MHPPPISLCHGAHQQFQELVSVTGDLVAEHSRPQGVMQARERVGEVLVGRNQP